MPKIGQAPGRMLALDTETTGVDLHHGAKPFFVSTCDGDGVQRYWEWDVDPITRQPTIPPDDLDSIRQALDQASQLILQNPKFDAAALATMMPTGWQFPWEKVLDTLLAGHLLASNHRHDLTSMALEYLGIDNLHYEEDLKRCCNEARRLVRSKLPHWRIAKEGLPDMPSAKGGSKKDAQGVESDSPWKFDCWLPRRVAAELGYNDDHEYWTVLSNYSNNDSETTLMLWNVMRRELERRDLWEIYLVRMKLPRIAYGMEYVGVGVSGERLGKQYTEYREESDTAASVCVNLAGSLGYDLELPQGNGVNNSLRRFCFDVLKLPPRKRSGKTGEPSLDKSVMEGYLAELPANSKQLSFVKALLGKRRRDTALTYMDSYRKFWLPIEGQPEWYRLHPRLNPTGTDTLRWSSSNPNEQNISKKEGFNLRYSFGPLPGREWWSMDAENIELRIPAYVSGEQAMIELFEQPNDPPYFGSNHLLVSHVLHPKLFEECINPELGCVDGRIFKKKYASTWYQWVKNGNFAVTYGAVAESGTADRAYHVPGGQRIVEARFTKIKQLNERMIRMAERLGYVETMPDRTVNPKRGYPLLCTRSEWGGILPTVPLNYFSQGTACWWMVKAMIRCQEQLDQWRAQDGFTGHIVMQVHDELVFDFPKLGDPVAEAKAVKAASGKPVLRTSNLWRTRVLQKLMAQSGDDIGVPTPVSCEFHSDNWSEGVKV